MSKSNPQALVLLALLIYLIRATSVIGGPKLRCKEAERIALLGIKDNLYVQNSTLDIQEPEVVLSSWVLEEEKRECCEWIGVRCDNKTGNVIMLDLSPSSLNADDFTLLVGNISSSLAQLQYLNYLDLSKIDLGGNSIPSFIGTFSNLRYLNLSSTSLSGEVPPQLGNLSSLQVIDLSHSSDLNIKNLEWASRLSNLEILDLSSTFMEGANDWLQVAINLPSLTSLLLSDCALPTVVLPKSLALANSSKPLTVLDLSFNSQLSNSTFTWLFNYSQSLVHLDISWCSFESTLIPTGFGNMASLSFLSLAETQIRGSIPVSLGNVTSLEHLDLSQNKLEGFIPKSFGNLTSLEHLDLRYNMLEGEIPKYIWEICALKHFDAYGNKLSGLLELSASSSMCEHFSLEYIDLTQNRVTGPLTNFTLYPLLKEMHLSSNQLSGNVSESIGQLSKLEILDISENHIEAVMSKPHFAKLPSLHYLDLSSNSHIALDIPSDWIPPFNLDYINLGSCKMGPDFPRWLRTQNNYSELNISRAGISDFIPSWFWNLPAPLISLDLSNNQIMGTIPDQNHNFTYLYVEIDLSTNQFEGSVPLFLLQVNALNLFQNRFSDLTSICNTRTNIELSFLDVSYNQLSGEVPDCWSNTKDLKILILGNNKFTGKIPISIGLLTSIETLHLANNNFSGELPLSLENCTKLMVFDVGGNELNGEIPVWIGKSVEKLVILSLRSNNFYGSLGLKLCRLGNLQVLDFSSNNLSGIIPTCLGNISAMRQVESVVYNIQHLYDFHGFPGFLLRYNDKLSAQWKGSLSEFQNLGLFKNLDLSSNKLTGEIPKQITELVGLVSLNMSRNNLTGRIPEEIGRMKSLDALDLSVNNLCGQIPSSLAQVDRLGILDLSNNNLSGKIPTGPQLQTRGATAYLGNPQLCGDPLPKKCTTKQGTAISKAPPEDSDSQEDQDGFISIGFFVCVGVRFVVGFWGVCGSLIFNKSWRYGYFKLLDNVGDWIYVATQVNRAKLLRLVRG